MHSHLGVDAAPALRGSDDTNSLKGSVQPWLRSLDGFDTHDEAFNGSIAGGITTMLVLPGSASTWERLYLFPFTSCPVPLVLYLLSFTSCPLSCLSPTFSPPPLTPRRDRRHRVPVQTPLDRRKHPTVDARRAGL
jgi:hypothetical protein